MQDSRSSHQHHQRIGRRMSQQQPLPSPPPYFNAAMMTQAYYNNNVPPELYDPVQGGAFLPHLPRPFEPFPSPEVRTILVRQIECYFCADNLSKDVFLRQNMDEQGWVGVSLIANFNRVKQLTNDIPFILDSLRGSSVVEIQIMEQLENRMDEDQVDEILQMVVELLQPPRGNNPDEDDPMEQDEEAQ